MRPLAKYQQWRYPGAPALANLQETVARLQLTGQFSRKASLGTEVLPLSPEQEGSRKYQHNFPQKQCD